MYKVIIKDDAWKNYVGQADFETPWYVSSEMGCITPGFKELRYLGYPEGVSRDFCVQAIVHKHGELQLKTNSWIKQGDYIQLRKGNNSNVMAYILPTAWKNYLLPGDLAPWYVNVINRDIVSGYKDLSFFGCVDRSSNDFQVKGAVYPTGIIRFESKMILKAGDYETFMD